MKTLHKRALLALFLAASLPTMNGCKELNGDQSVTENHNDVVDPVTEVVDPSEPTFEPIQVNAAPQDLTGYPGQSATFTVTASSAATLTYQWYQNNTEIPGATSNTLSFIINGSEDAGTYTVRISNLTNSTSQSARLFVTALPDITREPQDVSIYPGETAVFTVSASGDDVEYQWQSRGLLGWNTLDETSDTLVVEDVSTSTKKQYRVKVKNDGGQKTSRTTRINLKNPISITSQPTSQLVASGENAAFTVTATGYGTLSYQWYRAGTALSDNSKYQGTRSANLSVLNVTPSDASLYYVAISNDEGRSMNSASAELSVQGPAFVTVHPNDTTVYSGGSGELLIAASGDNPISYQWQKWNGSSWQNISGANASRLSFATVTSSTAGRYRCSVSNAVSSDVSNAATVTVLQSVNIDQSPVSQTAQVGESVRFSVIASGDDLQYEWTKNGQSLPNSGATLSFASVRELDEASYGCRVYNSGGSANCAAFSLDVQSPVIINTQPTPQSTYEGGSIALNVVASGDPAPSVEWYFNGEIVGSGNTLTLNNVSAQQAGEYQCLVSNDISSSYCDPVTVSISNAVQITSEPVNTSANEGTSVNFTVVASGENLNYDWLKDGQSLGLNSPTLSLSELSAEDAGSYTCRVWNEYSSVHCTDFSLTINGLVAITTQPVGSTAYEDANVTLAVEHNGGEEAQVNWYFNDLLIASDTRLLTLSPLTLEQAGEYRCVVATPVNSVACNPVTVVVLEKARITKQPSSQILSVGESFTLDLQASGEGPLQYQCFFNGSLVLSSTQTSQLVINNITAANAGAYYCTVSNEGSTVTSDTVSLDVLGIESRRVLVTWDAPDSRADDSLLDPLEIAGYSIHICPEGSNQFELMATTQGTGTEAIIELAPGTYDLAVTTIDVNGLESSLSAANPIVIE
ncbi:MAG: immunoglobulin domain-containing protein [Ketobacter sp.]|jgi:hypothetical protein|nr:immunoglobulin domain-containing protein [Ketobacter sp.]MEC8813882.1 immunoglobulin domain-containing protein [Pseudomonadota bacterium]|tara:strand:+ start:1534 stop:4284 length:2751 start_codon:yes stop_codon:yes gene_type:complete